MKTILALLLILLAGCTATPEHAAHAQERGNAGDYAVRLHTVPDTLVPGEEATLHLAIRRKDGSPVAFDIIHEKPVHVMLLRDDLQHFAHIHADEPAEAYTLAHAFPEPGNYRAVIEFSEHGKTVAVPLDITVPGEYEPQPVAESERAFSADGYGVVLDAPAQLRAGSEQDLHFTVSKELRTVTDLGNYLGEKMHLAVWGEGFSHFEHAHPAAGEELAFHVTFPKPGTYKLFAQFKHEERVTTAEFAVNVI
jgi:hypothetical protein